MGTTPFPPSQDPTVAPHQGLTAVKDTEVERKVKEWESQFTKRAVEGNGVDTRTSDKTLS